MPWKFVCDLRFHEVLLTTIIRHITKESKEIEKYSQKPLELYTNLYVCLWESVCVGYSCVLLCVDVWVVFSICMCEDIFIPIL